MNEDEDNRDPMIPIPFQLYFLNFVLDKERVKMNCYKTIEGACKFTD